MLRHTLVSGAVLAMVLAAPRESAAYDFGSLFRPQPPSRVNPRQAAEAQGSKTCDQVNALLDAGPLPGGPTQRGPDAADALLRALLEPRRFVSAFGTPYEQLTVPELSAMWQTYMRSCNVARGVADPTAQAMQRQAIATMLNPSRRPANLKLIETGLVSSDDTVRLTNELNGLQADDAGYERFLAIGNSGPAIARKADAPLRQAFEAALSDAQQRIAVPVERARVADAVARARGYEGFAQLEKMLGTTRSLLIRRIGGPESASAKENVSTLTAKLEQLANELAANERGRVDALGSGVVALERGVQWQNEFSQKFANANHYPSLTATQAYFSDRREPTLRVAAAELNPLILRTKTEAQLNDLQQRYLLPSDGATVGGTALLTAISTQKRELEKIAAMGPDFERRSPAPAPAPAGKPAAPATKTTESASGEPSEEVMYELVRGVFDAESERIADLQKRCKNGGGGNIMDMSICLGVGINGSMGAYDQPTRVVKFEKVGCDKAVGRAGYECDFDYTLTGSSSRFMGPITKSLAGGGGGPGHARFVYNKSGWRMLYKGGMQE